MELQFLYQATFWGEISKYATRIGIIHSGHLIQELDTDKLNELCKKCLLIDAIDKNAVVTVLSQNGYPLK